MLEGWGMCSALQTARKFCWPFWKACTAGTSCYTKSFPCWHRSWWIHSVILVFTFWICHVLYLVPLNNMFEWQNFCWGICRKWLAWFKLLYFINLKENSWNDDVVLHFLDTALFTSKQAVLEGCGMCSALQTSRKFCWPFWKACTAGTSCYIKSFPC